MPTRRITAAGLEKLKPGETLWDTEVRGLGARRQTEAGAVTFVFKARVPATGRQRFLTIGRWGRGDWGIDEARKKATQHRDALRLGRDPGAERDEAKRQMSVAELCDAYLEAAPNLLTRNGRPKKDRTLSYDRGRIELHIKQHLGDLPLNGVTRLDVETFMHRVGKGREQGGRPSGGKVAASRTMGLLGAIFAFAVSRNMRPDNPVRGVTRYADRKRERRLSDDEYRALAGGLTAAEAAGMNPTGIAVVRLLVLTGWRRSEAAELRWAEVDLLRRTARLEDTKSGASVRPLARSAAALITAQPRTCSPHVFPARVVGKGLQGLPKLWQRIRTLAGLPADITLHTLRHSFASTAADAGYGDAAIAGLLGHKRGGTTARYTHAADAVLLEVADEVARVTQTKMGGDDALPAAAANVVVPLRAAV
jgi:integrase